MKVHGRSSTYIQAADKSELIPAFMQTFEFRKVEEARHYRSGRDKEKDVLKTSTFVIRKGKSGAMKDHHYVTVYTKRPT